MSSIVLLALGVFVVFSAILPFLVWLVKRQEPHDD